MRILIRLGVTYSTKTCLRSTCNKPSLVPVKYSGEKWTLCHVRDLEGAFKTSSKSTSGGGGYSQTYAGARMQISEMMGGWGSAGPGECDVRPEEPRAASWELRSERWEPWLESSLTSSGHSGGVSRGSSFHHNMVYSMHYNMRDINATEIIITLIKYLNW